MWNINIHLCYPVVAVILLCYRNPTMSRCLCVLHSAIFHNVLYWKVGSIYIGSPGVYYSDPVSLSLGTLTFILVCGPKGRTKGACERAAAEFWILVNWISLQNIALWTAILTQFEALELYSSLILRLWSLQPLKICDYGVSESRVLRTEKYWNGGVLRTTRTRRV